MDSGLGEQLGTWILASIADANLGYAAAYKTELSLLIKSIVAASLFALFAPAAIRSCSLLTSFLSRLATAPGGTSATDAILDAMRSKSRELKIKNEAPLKTNILRTLGWVAFCYCLIFAFVMVVPYTDGQFFLSFRRFVMHLPEAEATLQSRLFMASIVALYGTGTMAVSGVVFLPNSKMPHLSINREGVLFPKQFLLSLIFRPLRLWADFESVSLIGSKKRRQLIHIEFKSGGHCRFNPQRMAKEELNEFLTAIDEMSLDCEQSAEVLAFRAKLQEEIPQKKYGDNRQVTKIASSNYRSTTFIPHAAGEVLESGLRIIKKISSKPLAAVYLVRGSGHKLFILKQFVLPSETDENLVFKRQFHREYELLKKIDHPHIVKLNDVFEEGNSSYILLEHLEGQDLHTYVAERKKLSEKVVLKWAIELCEIASYLHRQNPPVLHRDLTPDNLIVGSDQDLKLLDFGAANQFLEGVTGTLVGKQAYVPPEQLRGKATRQSDIYSFGATLYFLLTGLQPRALAQSDVIGAGEKISHSLNELIKDCTEFDEAKRPASFNEIFKRLVSMAGREMNAVVPTTDQFVSTLPELLPLQLEEPALLQADDLFGISASKLEQTTGKDKIDEMKDQADEKKSQMIKINFKRKDMIKEPYQMSESII